ncbi:5-methyltetrahydropteroyltriglutamate--homocysteine S-methyltransferase [Paenibacillus sp. WLX1005]|uniref:5-methyltetrahydropteroyltriglutamate-- homocysteine S-methyltransferase n=1 Tax=Paenibacillus sp. WLX1005 TaxID=3243766 RepID=UPI00398419A3
MSIVFNNEQAVQRKNVPFRNDIVGSFLRPANLKEARTQFQNNEITAEQLRSIEDEEITKLVQKQKEVGLKAVTDGEFRRSWWHLDFFWGFEGVTKKVLGEGYLFHGVETRAETAYASGKIKYANHPHLDDFKFLKRVAGDDVIARQTIPSPAQLFLELNRNEENRAELAKVYSDNNELVADVAKAYRDAILAFYEAGCRNLQLDDCTWGMLCDTKFTEAQGIDTAVVAKLYAHLNNEAIKDLPEDLTVTMHVCRGNFKSTWAGSGGYEPIAEVLFGTVNVDAFYLEFDTDRAGDFSPLRHVPANKQVVLGLFSSKIGELENKETILKRIEEATEFLNINQICLSPQCGFASTEEGNILTEQQQWDKLRFIKEIADEVWHS